MTTTSPASIQSLANSLSTSVNRGQAGVETGRIAPKSDNSTPTDVANENAVLTVDEVNQTVEALNQAMQQLRRGLNFRIDEKSGETVIAVIDKQTDEVIRQIPSDDILRLSAHMQEMQHLLFDDYA